MEIEELLAALISRRKELKLTQLAVAERAGAVQLQVSQWEVHMGEPSLRKLWRWMAAIGVTVVVVPVEGFEVGDDA